MSENQNDGDEVREPDPDLAYTTARTILAGEDDDLLFGSLRITELDDERWHVTRVEDDRGVAVEAEADVFFPERFRSAQTLGSYLLGLALTDEKDWPAYIPEDPP